MNVQCVTPILNVSDLGASFAWFETFGWKKRWDWGSPPTFGAVGNGNQEIFLCLDGQGGRGKGTNTRTMGPGGSETGDLGVWMSIFVDDVDTLYADFGAAGLDITMPPTNMPWGVREMHVRHPDGHVFRVGKGCD